jgi:hypothetical protein
MLYGSSTNIAHAQRQFKKAYFELKESEMKHNFPAVLTENAEIAKNTIPKKAPEVNPERTKFYCTNYCCGQVFTINSNSKTSCNYHSGVWQFGSYNVSIRFYFRVTGRSPGHVAKEAGIAMAVLLENTMEYCWRINL